ncbi:hypothetical protein [uncultured Nostoc sp.]|uniref:hypothetical protein n=1 Tax=uncultured Nostoc sp. TaxID=340711 RepID=UPI0035CA9085
MAKNQDCGVEPKDCHEGTCSAAPVVQNEFCLSSAIANQTQEQLEQSYSASLSGENQVSGVEVKAVDEGKGCAAPVPQPEKWSHEAIVVRSNMRPERMQKLTRCGEFGAESGV